MKKLINISKVLFLLVGLVLTSCETTDLDLLDNPNEITPDKAELGRYEVQVQLDYASFMRNIGNKGAELTRVEYMFGRLYNDNYEPAFQDFAWDTAYHIFNDMQSAEALATEAEANNTIGVLKILKGHILITLVDFFGDIPLSQANNPAEFPFPIADPGASVYQNAIAMIDEGMALLDANSFGLSTDYFYGNDFNKWKKFGNTVKMAAYLNTGDLASFNAIANNSASYISSNADDFQFQYGTNLADPDTRHPAYAADYTTSGAGNYRSNWLMDKMLNTNDPRRFYYFYRQFGCTPGASCDPNGNQTTLSCSVAARPPHFPAGMVYCSVEDGYWGRDHGNPDGIPPDGFKRTVVGVYPAAGRFDAGETAATTLGAGGAGAGILPIMLASWVDLMKAEAMLEANNASGALNMLNSSLNKSVDKVMASIAWDPQADLSGVPSSNDVSSFKNAIASAFTSGSTQAKWNILGEQRLIADYGSGVGAYNFYRRTGYPTTVQYNIDPNPGPFVRSLYYSASEANTNPNITQKPNVAVQVFWDTNPPSPGFPSSN